MTKKSKQNNNPVFKDCPEGDKYVICSEKDKLLPVCDALDLNESAVHYNRKFGCFAIKLEKHHAAAIQMSKIV